MDAAVLIAPHAVALRQGLNLVAWLGPSGTALADAVGPLGEAMQIAFNFDADSQVFGSFAAGRPGVLNTDRPLCYGDGLWLNMRAPATWTQPVPSAPASIAADDGLATLVIPPGALPAGVSADGIVIRDVSDEAPFAPVGGGLDLAALSLEPSGLVFTAPALLMVEIAEPPGGVFMFAFLSTGLSTGEAFEPIEIPEARFDEETGRAQVDAVLPHFSDFVIYMDHVDSLLTLNFDATTTMDDRNLGRVSGTFPVNLPITSSVGGEQTWETRTTTTQLVTNGGAWDVSASFDPDEDSRPILSPSRRVAAAEEGTSAPRGTTRTLTLRTTFTCEMPGDFRIQVFGGASVVVEQDYVTRTTTDGSIVASAFRIASGVARLVANVTGECFDPDTPPPGSNCCGITPDEDLRYTAAFSGARGDCTGFPPSFSDATYVLRVELPSDPMMDGWSLRATQGSTNQAVAGPWDPTTGAWSAESPDGSRLEVYRDGTTSPDGSLMATYEHVNGSGVCSYDSTLSPR